MKFQLRSELPMIILIGIQFLIPVLAGDYIPDTVPIHWNIHGEPDDYGSKYFPAFLVAGIYLLLLILPFIDPRKKNYNAFSGPYYKIRTGLVILFSIINILSLLYATGVEFNFSKIIIILIFMVFTVIGNYMGNLKSNWFVGIRLPWTMESEEVWKRTHRLASRIWFWSGIAGMALTIVVPVETIPWILFSLLAVMILIPVIYSFTLYQKLK